MSSNASRLLEAAVAAAHSEYHGVSDLQRKRNRGVAAEPHDARHQTMIDALRCCHRSDKYLKSIENLSGAREPQRATTLTNAARQASGRFLAPVKKLKS